MNIEFLEKTCKRIIALEPSFKLAMDSYCIDVDGGEGDHSDINVCKTTYCIVGILAHYDGYPEQFVDLDDDDGVKKELFEYHHYATHMLIGKHPTFEYFHWLFDADWPDSLEHAKARAQYLLDNDYKIPEYTYNLPLSFFNK